MFTFGQDQFRAIRQLTLYANTRYLYRILEKFESLEECIVLVEPWHVIENVLEEPSASYTASRPANNHIIRPNLKTLELIVNPAAHDFPTFLNDITLPSLRIFQIKVPFGMLIQAMLFSHVHTLLHRSRPQLKSLAIEGIPVEDSNLLITLSMLPTLKHLILRAKSIPEWMFFHSFCDGGAKTTHKSRLTN